MSNTDLIVGATITIKREQRIKLPTLPNFICQADSEGSTAVSEFTEEQLREIGSQWTEALVRHADAMRRKKVRQLNKTNRRVLKEAGWHE